MDNFEIVPPESVWDNIEGVLLKNKAIVRRNRIIGAAVATIVLVSLLYMFFNFNKKNEVKPGEPEIQSSPSSVNIYDTVISNTANAGSSVQGSTNKGHVIQQNNSGNNIELKDKNKIDTAVLVEKANIKLNTDTIPQNTPPAEKEKVVVKKIIKKPVYIVQQDTIYKVDTLSKKKKW
jgi:hypothetical protein